MKSFQERCVELRKQDKSIIEIMEITGRSKSTIYPYIKDIPLSVARIKRHKKAAADRIRQYPLARKGKSARAFRTFDEWSPDIINLVSHLMFDGSFSYGGCVYNNRSEELVDKVRELMRILYNYEPKRWRNPITGVHRISYHNVALGAYLKDKARDLIKGIKGLSLPHKRAFLQAFFDDEGCMDFRPLANRRGVRGYQKDVSILRIVQTLLSEFEIEARIIKPNEIIIVGKENLLRFEREINFSTGVYMNGNRSNSRWKKHVEKRQLLHKAIESYQS